MVSVAVAPSTITISFVDGGEAPLDCRYIELAKTFILICRSESVKYTDLYQAYKFKIYGKKEDSLLI